MFLSAAASFRSCSSIWEIFRPYLPWLPSAPSPNTIQGWLLRLGVYELTRPKEEANDWVWMLDHTLQLGPVKCLLIVGIRRSTWQALQRPLQHQDLTMIAEVPMEKTDGELVREQLEAAVEQVGPPQAILTDAGSDLRKAKAKFKELYPDTQLLQDSPHYAAVLLKRELLADPRWADFVQHCGQTHPKVKQTELGFLASPTQKVKGRYMNLGPLMRWGQRMLRLVQNPQDHHVKPVNLTRLEEKYGWIRPFEEALSTWNDLHAVKDEALELIRHEGYHAQAALHLRLLLEGVAQTEPGQRMAGALVSFVQEQSQGVPPGESLPGSTEVLESLIGKGKRMQGQHSRGGFTKMILAMAASVTRLTQDHLQAALETVRHNDMLAWCEQTLGVSQAALRRHLLPVLPEQKSDKLHAA
jgi:hypothetical protein